MPWTAVSLAVCLLAGTPPSPAPLYTNADLDRVAARRGETGVLSAVALPPAPEEATGPGSEAAGRARAEAYWRRQADRHRERLRLARERAEALRARIAAREASPLRDRAGRRGPDAQAEAWRRQLALIEESVREEEGRFADRARRAGALPGWLR